MTLEKGKPWPERAAHAAFAIAIALLLSQIWAERALEGTGGTSATVIWSNSWRLSIRAQTWTDTRRMTWTRTWTAMSKTSKVMKGMKTATKKEGVVGADGADLSVAETRCRRLLPEVPQRAEMDGDEEASKDGTR